MYTADGREFANFLRSLGQFILTAKVQNNFWSQNAFLTCSWRFLISNILELRLEKKILGFRNMQEKLEKVYLYIQVTNQEREKSFTFI